MDPNETYRDLIRAWSEFQQYRERAHTDAFYAAERMADAVEALDTWIRGGGFLPSAWGAR